MADSIHWVLVTHGEVAYETWQKDSKEILTEARLAVDQHICDHLRHDLPFQVTEQTAREFDVRAFSLPREGQGVPERLVLPYQQWVDEYYQRGLQDDKDSEERQYKYYLELREKHEPRRVKEQESSGWGKPSPIDH